MGYSFYDVDACGRGNNGVAQGPPRLLADDAQVTKYLSQQRANGWHAMVLARRPPDPPKPSRGAPPDPAAPGSGSVRGAARAAGGAPRAAGAAAAAVVAAEKAQAASIVRQSSALGNSARATASAAGVASAANTSRGGRLRESARRDGKRAVDELGSMLYGKTGTSLAGGPSHVLQLQQAKGLSHIGYAVLVPLHPSAYNGAHMPAQAASPRPSSLPPPPRPSPPPPSPPARAVLFPLCSLPARPHDLAPPRQALCATFPLKPAPWPGGWQC